MRRSDVGGCASGFTGGDVWDEEDDDVDPTPEMHRRRGKR